MFCDFLAWQAGTTRRQGQWGRKYPNISWLPGYNQSHSNYMRRRHHLREENASEVRE
jgi:hypothetical protein